MRKNVETVLTQYIGYYESDFNVYYTISVPGTHSYRVEAVSASYAIFNTVDRLLTIYSTSTNCEAIPRAVSLNLPESVNLPENTRFN